MLLEIGIALVQPYVTLNKTDNVNTAIRLIRSAVTKYNPRIVTLPEFFNAPYVIELIKENAESIPDGYTSQALSNLAKELKVFIVGGTIPEVVYGHQFYNTTTVWSPNGQLIATHRKVRFLCCPTVCYYAKFCA